MTSDEVVQTLLGAAVGNTASPQGSGGQSAPADEAGRQLTENLGKLAMQIADLKQTSDAQVAGIEQNTQATLENTVAKVEQSGSSTASTIGHVLTSIGSTLTLSPLIGGLVKLFGGGGSEEPPELPVYTPPSSIQAEGAPGLTGPLSVDAISYGSDGLPRRVGGEAAPATAGAPAITIQVQAIDSRSFLDHSDSIARAVREAMLNMHGLNDVIAEL